MFKSKLFSFCLNASFLFFGTNLFAQKSIDLNDLITNISEKKEESSLSKKSFQGGEQYSIEFDKKYFKGNIENYKIIKVSENEFNIQKSGQTENLFYLKKRNGTISGVLLDTKQNLGYVISYKDNEVVFTETPKDKLVYSCSFDNPKKELESFGGISAPKFLGNADTESNVLALESNPNSINLVYLDFDGGEDISPHSQTYSVGDVSDNTIRAYWEAVSESFAAFDVNITTNRTLFDQHPNSRKQMVVFAIIHYSKYGTAFYDSFGNDMPALVNIGQIDFAHLKRTAAHEIGHTLGLRHDGTIASNDGTIAEDYYLGHGEYAPIMGSGGKPFAQWSKGEYANANNTEDDIAIISGILGFKKDSHPFVTSLQIESTGAILANLNHGIIETSTDVDTFQFTLKKAGQVEFDIGSPKIFKTLDIQTKILDSNNIEVFNENPVGQRNVVITKQLSAGRYRLTVEGGSELTVNDGWNDYGSIGFYEISGQIENYEKFSDDIFLKGMSETQEFCGNSYNVSVEVANVGVSEIKEFTLKVFVNDVLESTKLISKNIKPDEVISIELDPLTKAGESLIKVKAILDNDENSYNNEISESYVLNKGIASQFITNIETYNGSNPISWEIKKTNVLESSNEYVVFSEMNETKQNFCLSSSGCHDFVITGDYSTCSNIKPFSIISNVNNAGDRVHHEGKIYEAKWYISTAPPGQAWTLVGECTERPYDFSLKFLANDSTVFSKKSTDFSGSPTVSFCTDQEVTTKLNYTLESKPQMSIENGYFIFPENFGNGILEILDSKGSIIHKNKIVNNRVSIDKTLDKGSYYLRLTNKKGSVLNANFVK